MRFISRCLAAFTILALILGLTALVGQWLINQVLARYNIQDLDYRIAAFSLHGVHFDRLVFTHQAERAQQQFRLSEMKIVWRWNGLFAPQIITVNTAQAEWNYLALESAEINDDEFQLPTNWQLPDILPQHIIIDRAIFTLPCHIGRCSVRGPIDVHREGSNINATLLLSQADRFNPEEALSIRASYHLHEQLPQLNLTLDAGPAFQIRLTTGLLSPDAMIWHGVLSSELHYPPPWIRRSLANWNIVLDKQWAEAIQEPLVVDIRWRLALIPLMTFDVAHWNKALQGQVELGLELPSAVELVGYGKIAGKLALVFDADDNQIKNYAVSADISMTDVVQPAFMETLGMSASTLHLDVSSMQNAMVDLQKLPLAFSLEIEDQLTAKVTGNIMLDTLEQRVDFNAVNIKAATPILIPVESWQFQAVTMDLLLSGKLYRDRFDMQLGGEALVAQLSLPLIDAQTVQIHTEKLNISGNLQDGDVQWASVSAQGTAELSIQQLQHPQLHPMPWVWRGKLDGSAEQFTAAGKLSINDAINIDHTLKGSAERVEGSWQISEVFLLAGNPFATLVNTWPALLVLERGKIQAKGDFAYDLTLSNLTRSHTAIQLGDVSGIYDTTAFRGLTTRLELLTQEHSVHLNADDLKLTQINKGIVMGPFVAAGQYDSSLNEMLKGRFMLEKFSGEVMGGQVSTQARQFDLSKDKQALTLVLEDIDLGKLLQQHPSTELKGSGRISGSIPIEISAAGIRVAQGAVAAEPPGGQLQYHSERAESIARSQPSMKLITEALEDFHYSVLASEVSYDEDGKLLLALRLEGRNPALENGRPVHFNISLEENLPAMLASIQLSSQISDVIKKRLQERIKKRPAKTD